MNVFVSSVMQGFAKQREAAGKAIESLGHTPVMAETFGARPYSSEQACREGVHQSQCYVGVLGARYGYAPDGRRSVTREEYETARELGLPVVLMIENSKDREPQQVKWVSELMEYKDGYFAGKFETVEELQAGVVEGVKNAFAPPSHLPHAKARLRSLLATVDARPGAPTLTVAATPVDAVPALDVRRLNEESLTDAIERSARFDGKFFTKSLGSDSRHEEDSVTLGQFNGHSDPVRAVKVCLDRSVVVQGRLDASRKVSNTQWDFLGSMVVDEAAVKASLATALRLIGAVHRDALGVGAPARVAIQAALTGSEGKRFGKPPGDRVNSMSQGRGLQGLVVVPSAPEVVAFSALATPQETADRLVAHIERAFRAADSLYPDAGPGRGGFRF